MEVIVINLCYKINLPSKMLMPVAPIMFLFLIQLRYHKSKSISDILHRRYSQSGVWTIALKENCPRLGLEFGL